MPYLRCHIIFLMSLNCDRSALLLPTNSVITTLHPTIHRQLDLPTRASHLPSRSSPNSCHSPLRSPLVNSCLYQTCLHLPRIINPTPRSHDKLQSDNSTLPDVSFSTYGNLIRDDTRTDSHPQLSDRHRYRMFSCINISSLKFCRMRSTIA